MKDFTFSTALSNSENLFLKLLCDGEGAGFIALKPLNGVTCEVHIVVREEFRGLTAIQLCNEALDWIWTFTKCKKLVAMIPSYNIPAKALATRLGFETEGRVRKAFEKNMELYDLIVMGKEK